MIISQVLNSKYSQGLKHRLAKHVFIKLIVKTLRSKMSADSTSEILYQKKKRKKKGGQIIFPHQKKTQDTYTWILAWIEYLQIIIILLLANKEGKNCRNGMIDNTFVILVTKNHVLNLHNILFTMTKNPASCLREQKKKCNHFTQSLLHTCFFFYIHKRKQILPDIHGWFNNTKNE